ncbi:M20/M25/M40 family metallo-hydrolase [Congregibacter variabilis]|uniref:M20/M25/M40 family metallo-hydrolase n=1 Tax=Congregibacter variabilis TaxID=3081200 RepID=A0ABZ0I7J1_9GAMM|nr:M20/M25/M40 family metallo-hydrolase [Congregibacter sp. IMCC43200]
MMRTFGLGLFALALVSPLYSFAQEVGRPQYSIDMSYPYDYSSIPVYSQAHEAIYKHIDDNLPAHVSNLQRWLRQPSISAQDVGIDAMAQMLVDDFRAMGFQEAELVPTDGHPGVWGYLDSGAAKTLMVYMMYDVQPVNPEDWQSPPFAAELVDHATGKVIMARGATNQKGPQRAFLNALESILAVEGKLPVNLMITAEGEEELGSPHYPQIVDKYEDRLLTADGVIFPMNMQSPAGDLNLFLGVKGIAYWELEARGGSWGGPVTSEIHGSYKAALDSPVWRLIQALASLTSPDGNTALVPGFYDGIRGPTEEEQSLIAASLLNNDSTSALQEAFAIERWIDDAGPQQRVMELTYSPTLNIDGIYAGYTGEGVKTILPHTATAKMDSRLPVGIDPEEHMDKIRAYLDANGYSDIVMRRLSSYPAAQTSIQTPLVQAALGVSKKYAGTPAVNPRIAGSAPFYQFTQRLKLPMMPWGMGFGNGAHSPNEIMLIEPAKDSGAAGLADIEKAYVDFVYALSGE